MRRISAMYQLSGGTCWQHTCGECDACLTEPAGKKKVRKCREYRQISGTDPDWNPKSTACRFFRPALPEKTELGIMQQEAKEILESEEQEGRIARQMTIEDFPEVMP